MAQSPFAFIMKGSSGAQAQSTCAMSVSLTFRCCRTPDRERVVGAWALYEDVNSKYPYKKGWTTPDTPHPLPYEIRRIGSKGRGMVALREIKRGEVIVNDRPVIVTPSLTSHNDPNMDEVLLRLLYWLEQEDRQKVVQLHNCRPLDECGPLVGVLRTNSFGINFPESQICTKYGAICLNMSHINHSCVPNAIYSVDNDTVVFTLRASRDIALGEEITIAYIGDGETSAVRKAKLQERYGFICTCTLCSAPAAIAAASDKRREFIKATFGRLLRMWVDWVKLPPGARSAQTKRDVQMIEKLLQAMDKENISTGRIVPSQQCCLMYAVLCDVKNFKKWARRCLKVAREEEPTFVKEWECWLNDPTSCPAWDMLRVDVDIASLLRQPNMHS